MHELDQMTPNQRLNAFMTGQAMDRMLAMPVIVSMSGDVCGMTHREKRSSPENEAKCQIEAYKRFGNDLAVIEYGLHMVGVGLGGTTNDPEFQTPAIATYPLESLDDIDKLDPERLKKENDPHLRHCLEACHIVKEEIGDEVPVGVLITGPYTAATSCYPAEKLFRAMRKSPEKVHRLVQFTTDCLIDIYKEFIQEGVLILQCDPLASGTILRKSQYQEFVLPYAKKVNQAIHDAGGMVCYHICGDTTKTIDDLADAGSDMISVDNVVDLEHVKNTAGQKMPILGNVAPVDYFIQGTKEEMEAAVKRCLQKAWDSPNGYILASGCDLSGQVKLENIEAFMNAARKYGKWPLDPKNFE